MISIKNFIKKILAIGIDDSLTSFEAKKIHLLNGICIYTIIALIISFIADFSVFDMSTLSDPFPFSKLFFAPVAVKALHSDKWWILIPVAEALFIVLTLVVLFLNYLKRYKLAIAVICFSSIFISSTLYIVSGHIGVTFMMLSFIPPIIFYSKKSTYIPIILIIGFVSLLIATYIIHYNNLIIFSKERSVHAVYENIIMVLGLFVFVLIYFKNEDVRYERKLKQQNKILKLQSDLISKQRDNLYVKNKELAASEKQLKQTNEELNSLNEDINNQKLKIERVHSQITDSINYAKRIQQAVFPPIKIFQNNFKDSFVFFRPRDIVSGDFYWTLKVEDEIIIAVADCTGHGVPGAFMSLLGISFFNEIIPKSTHKKASEILDLIRQKIKKTLKQTGKHEEQRDGMDMALCVINCKTRKMQYAGANNSLYLIRKISTTDEYLDKYSQIKQNEDVLFDIKADRQPVSVFFHESSFTNHQIDIQDDDTLYLFSDGFSDQLSGTTGKKFMTKNFKKLLLEINNYSMKKQLQILDNKFETWKAGSEQIDDVLILGIKL